LLDKGGKFGHYVISPYELGFLFELYRDDCTVPEYGGKYMAVQPAIIAKPLKHIELKMHSGHRRCFFWQKFCTVAYEEKYITSIYPSILDHKSAFTKYVGSKVKLPVYSTGRQSGL
jgi:hypothetical protein